MYVVHAQMKTAGSRKLLAKMRKEGFVIYLVNQYTGEIEPVNDGSALLRASSAFTGQKGYYLECLYNNNEKFPSLELLQAINEHEQVTYFGINRGDEFSL